MARSIVRRAARLAASLFLLAAGASAAAAAQDERIDPVLDDGAATGTTDAPEAGPPAPLPAREPAPDPYELRLDALAERFAEGVEAWRAGRYELAEGRWLDVLVDLDSTAADLRGRDRFFDRHVLLHGLGNAAFRLDRPLEAVGWYLAALRYAPRDRETRANLSLARRAAELEDESPTDFTSSVRASLDLVTASEARWLALLGLGPLLLTLLGEAARGGRVWRLLVAVAVLVAAAAATPLAHHLIAADAEPVMVVESEPVPLRAEPLEARPPIAELLPGAIVERIDGLPDWVRVERPDGSRGWVRAAAVFDLVR